MEPGKTRRYGTGRAYLFLLAPLIAIGLADCPLPVDTALATAVADKIAPSVVVASPQQGSYYAGTVHVSGTITDDALKAGDGKGTLKSVDYTLPNDVQRRGKLDISPDGTTTVDTKFGSGIITWTASTHTYAFDLDTVNPSVLHGTVTITVEATDANGNVSSQNINLGENTAGPVIALSSPTNLKYKAGTTNITLTGTVANSSTDTANADNITSIAWGVIGKNWGATIDAVKGPDTVANTGLFPVTNFVYTPGTRTFTTTFTVPFISDQNLLLTVTVKDANLHATVSQTYLVADVSGPSMVLTSPTANLYYSSTAFTPSVITGNVDPTSGLQTMTLQLTTTGGYTSSVVTVYPGNGTGDTGSYLFDPTGSGNFSFLMQGAAGSATLLGATGTATVTIKAVNSTATTTAQYNMVEDSVAPSIAPASVLMTSNNAATAYAKDGDTVTLTTQVSDTLSGLKAPPAVAISGVPATVTGPVGTTFTAQRVMAPGDAVDGSGRVTLSVSATDNAGNVASTTTAASTVTFYDGAPTLSSVSIHSNDTSTSWAKTGSIVTLSFNAPRNLIAVPAVTIAGHAATVSPTTLTAHAYTATYTMAGTEAEGAIPFSIAFTDAAGNVGTSVTATTDASQVTYDRTPPSISSVTFSPNSGWLKATQSVTVNIATSGDPSGLLTASAITVNNRAVSGFSDHHDGTYAVTYTVGADTNQAQNGIPVSVVMQDPAGNTNTAYTTVSGGTPGVDTVAPTVGTATFIPNSGWLKSGSQVEVDFTITEALSTPPKASAILVNGVDVSGTFANVSGSTYKVIYTVGSDTQRAVNGIPVSITVADQANNTSSASTSVTGGTPGVDTIAPSGYAVVAPTYVNSAAQTSMSFQITGAEVDSPTRATYSYTVSDGVTSVSGGPVNITATPITVSGVDASTLAEGPLTTSVTITDPAGNTGAPATATTTKDTTPPSISSVTNGAGNLSMIVTFTEGVYQSDLSGKLQSSAITVADTAPSATTTATVGTVTQNAGQPGVTFALSWSAPGPTKGDTIVVTTVAAKIYDAAGNANPGGEAGSDPLGAKFLRLFGVMVAPAGAQKPSGLAGVVTGWFQSPLERSLENGTAAIATVGESAPAQVPAQQSRSVKTAPAAAAVKPDQATQAAAPAKAPAAATAPAQAARADIVYAPAGGGAAAGGQAPAYRGAPAPAVPPALEPAVSPAVPDAAPAWWFIVLGALAASLVAGAAFWGIRLVKARSEGR